MITLGLVLIAVGTLLHATNVAAKIRRLEMRIDGLELLVSSSRKDLEKILDD
jgi:hypothetical protein